MKFVFFSLQDWYVHAFWALKFNDFMAHFCSIFPCSVRSAQYFRVKLLALYTKSHFMCKCKCKSIRAGMVGARSSAFYRLSQCAFFFLEILWLWNDICGRQKRNVRARIKYPNITQKLDMSCMYPSHNCEREQCIRGKRWWCFVFKTINAHGFCAYFENARNAWFCTHQKIS